MKDAATVYEGSDVYIQTISGRRFYMSHPEFHFEDFAHSLGMQCRFTGHTKHFYSVAEHSVLVSTLCRDLGECQDGRGRIEASFEGLMHDAHEGYITDLAAPWKPLVPDYRKVEGALEAKLRAWAGLPGDKVSPGVKLADWFALFIEARELLPFGITDDWMTPTPEFRRQLDALAPVYTIECFAPQLATHIFTEKYHALSRRRTMHHPV